MNLPIEVIEQAVQELHETYQPGARGVTLSQTSHGYQLIPSPELHEALRNTYGKRVDRRLTRAALETLSIIAYAQPVTRRDVENIRGVSSDSIMRMLLERGVYTRGRTEGCTRSPWTLRYNEKIPAPVRPEQHFRPAQTFRTGPTAILTE